MGEVEGMLLELRSQVQVLYFHQLQANSMSIERATHTFFARCFCCASCMQCEELLPFCTFWLFCSLFACYVYFFNEANFFRSKW